MKQKPLKTALIQTPCRRLRNSFTRLSNNRRVLRDLETLLQQILAPHPPLHLTAHNPRVPHLRLVKTHLVHPPPRLSLRPFRHHLTHPLTRKALHLRQILYAKNPMINLIPMIPTPKLSITASLQLATLTSWERLFVPKDQSCVPALLRHGFTF